MGRSRTKIPSPESQSPNPKDEGQADMRAVGIRDLGFGLWVLASRTLCLAVTLWLVAASQPAYAQHETSADVQDGARAFRQGCANCHGPDGDLIAGIDL